MYRYCSQCKKALKACICQWISPIKTKTQLVILQHPSEEKKPLGTARILALSLTNALIIVGEDFTHDDSLNALLKDDIDTYLLFPGDQAIEVCTANASQESDRPRRFILLDGTWKKAYKIWQLSKNLHPLPLVKLPSSLHGEYRIRKAPSENSLSTVEAGYHLLSAIEPGADCSSMLVAFREMINFQIKNMPPELYSKNYS